MKKPMPPKEPKKMKAMPKMKDDKMMGNKVMKKVKSDKY